MKKWSKLKTVLKSVPQFKKINNIGCFESVTNIEVNNRWLTTGLDSLGVYHFQQNLI